MITQTYGVIGMTCEHCVNAVRSELAELDGVTDVSVTLDAGSISNVSVTSAEPIPAQEIVKALDEAGDYTVAADPA